MSFLNYHKNESLMFNGHDSEAIPVGLTQYVMHYLYGANEPSLVKIAKSQLDGVEEATTEKERQKKLDTFSMMSGSSLTKDLPHGIAMSRNAAKNLMDFVYYVEGARGARIAVGPCICQLGLKKYFGGRTEPEIKDITLFYGADIYLDLGMGFKEITADEAKDILDEMHDRGHVHQALYMYEEPRGLFVMCNCDREICSTIRGTVLTGNDVVGKGPEICVHDKSKCLGVEKCGKCIERCPFEVNKADGDEILFDQSRCMGCELCVTTCEGKARTLEIREDYKYEHILSKTLLLAGKYGYGGIEPYEK